MMSSEKRTVTFVRTRTIVVTELHEAEVPADEPPHEWPTPELEASPAVVVPVSNTTTGGQVFPGTAVQYLRSRGVPQQSVVGLTRDEIRAETQKWLESLP
jgi:hypothetical protein